MTLWVATQGWGVLVERGAIFPAMGVVLGVLRLVARSVWTPIGFHLAFQVVAQSLLTQPGIEVSSPGASTIAGMIPPFVLAVTITLALTRNWPRPNWRGPEPEPGDSLATSGSDYRPHAHPLAGIARLRGVRGRERFQERCQAVRLPRLGGRWQHAFGALHVD